MAKHPLEVPAERLRNDLDPDTFDFETTADVEPLVGTVGQERGVSALQFGLDIKVYGYNIYVAGPAGTGKNTTILAHLHRVAAGEPVPPDWCYVHNFADSYCPNAISLPAGKCSALAQDMDELVESARREVPRAFESENYEQRKSEVTRRLAAERESISSALQASARENGLAMESTPIGIVTVPVVEGHPLSREDYEKLSDELKHEIQVRSERLRAEIEQGTSRIRRLEEQTGELVRQLDREIALFAVGHAFEELRRKYADYARVWDYLAHVQEDVVDHLEDFRSPEREASPLPGVDRLRREDIFTRYRVNVVVDNRGLQGAPVVIENNPTYYNLFGRLDYRGTLGVLATDFNMIRAGALQRANGGYLVVQARDVFTSPLAWETLKRTLRSREARIENLGEQFTAQPLATLKPEPIPLDTKVIMVGSHYIYHLLNGLDEDFRKLFRVKADFDLEMDRTAEHVRKYASFISARCRELGLLHFTRGGVAKVIEYSSRLREHQGKLSTRFIEVADIVSEASYWAAKDGAPYVQAEHVNKAVAEKVYRSSLVEEKMQELILDGTILIASAGAEPGQINGLSIHQLGDYYFGSPTRITARTAMGSGGMVNIEREVKMGGRIHDKGFYTLVGYLTGKYAQDKPLSLWASVSFEQVYDEVEGDSAASTELYALLSALAGVPIRQYIAVTGSVDQRGRVQAVGGATRKIEGFFAVCQARGLTGEQGVVVPAANLKSLMLREDVVEAVRAGQFHVWAVETVEQGIEILTGLPAGERRPDGTWPEGTINYLVDRTLSNYAEKLRRFERHAGQPRLKNHDEQEAA